MATITKVCRKSGDAYKAVIRLRVSKTFSKTFKLRKHAKAWADRIERDIEASRAYGNAHARTMTLSELIRLYIHYRPKQDKSGISNLNWWKRQYGSMKLVDINRTVVRSALNRLLAEDATHGNSTGRRLFPALCAALDKRQVGKAGQLQTFGCLSGACSVPASDVKGILMPRNDMCKLPCYLVGPQFLDGEQLRARNVPGTIFSRRAHIKYCWLVTTQLRSMQLFGSDG
jgi:hypothetical protein